MYYTKEQIDAANQTDLAAFLLSKGEELKRCGSETVWVRKQVWIRKNKWYSHYEQRGGYAVSFLMEYFSLDFPSAVGELISERGKDKPKRKDFRLPKPYGNMKRVYDYLMNERYIDREIIKYFADRKLIYEDSLYHNCVFVGLDSSGKPKHCHKRGTEGDFKMTVEGSISEHSFHFDGGGEWLFVFESPIDMLAFITLHPKDWKKYSYVALCSVSERPVLHRLESNDKITDIFLCLDNDEAGISACGRIKAILEEKGYRVTRLSPKHKDWDEDLIFERSSLPPKAVADKNKLTVLSAKYIRTAENNPVPPILTEKVKCAFTAVNESGYQRPVEQVENLLILLLQLAKDEARKCLSPITWEEISDILCKKILSEKAETLAADMQKLSYVYAQTTLECDRNLFLDPILSMSADCVRLIYSYRR